MLQTLDTQNLGQIALNEQQSSCMAALASQIDALNASMRSAVEAGMTIELRRSSRHHHDGGCWGDIIAPSVMKTA
jgi:hypothetical protein